MITLRLYQDKKVAVLGLAKAGTATVNSLLAGGAMIYAWDDKEASRKQFTERFGEGKTHLSAPSSWPWKELEMLVISPGIPLTHPAPHPAVLLAQEAGIPVKGDIELLHEAQPFATKIAITGTNGKSTTTSLIGHIIKTAGNTIQMGGNLGTPALFLDPVGGKDCYVLELSSYQLDLLHTARFNIALLINVTPDHIDRHGNMQRYVEAKAHIFDRQTKTDFAIVGVDDDYARSVYGALKQISAAQVIAISVQHELKTGIYVDRSGVLHDKIDATEQISVDISDIASLTGRHNWQNAAFAYAACKSYGLTTRDIEKGLRSFPGLQHRLQLVATIEGVRFINDSKATNAEACANALAPYKNIYWIVGGKPKEGGIASLHPYFPRITHAFLIGESEDAFAETLEGKVHYTRSRTLQQAFEEASAMAFEQHQPEAVVLLSPACASFDQWNSFEERGEAFCTMTETLLNQVIKGKRR